MVGKSIALATLLAIQLFHPLVASRSARELPDLRIQRYEFVSTNNKEIRVLVANDGKAVSKSCRLELSIRKINGVGATRTAFEMIPAIDSGKEVWITLTASGILPSAISLKETTFRLIA